MQVMGFWFWILAVWFGFWFWILEFRVWIWGFGVYVLSLCIWKRQCLCMLHVAIAIWKGQYKNQKTTHHAQVNWLCSLHRPQHSGVAEFQFVDGLKYVITWQWLQVWGRGIGTFRKPLPTWNAFQVFILEPYMPIMGPFLSQNQVPKYRRV